MELALLVYGISVLSGIDVLLRILFFGTLLLILAKFIVYDTRGYGYKADSKQKWDSVKSFCSKCLIALVFLLLGMVIIPSEKTSYLMLTAYATQKIAESPATQELSNKALIIINKKLDEYIQEPVPTK